MELKQKTIDTLQNYDDALSVFLFDFREWLKIDTPKTELQEALEDIYIKTGDGRDTLIYALNIARKEVKVKVIYSGCVEVELLN